MITMAVTLQNTSTYIILLFTLDYCYCDTTYQLGLKKETLELYVILVFHQNVLCRTTRQKDAFDLYKFTQT